MSIPASVYWEYSADDENPDSLVVGLVEDLLLLLLFCCSVYPKGVGIPPDEFLFNCDLTPELTTLAYYF